MIESLKNFLDTTQAPIIAWNIDSTIIFVNRAFEKSSGYRLEEINNSHVEMLFACPGHELPANRIEQAVSGVPWESVDLPIKTKDGEVKHALWNTFHIYDDQKRQIEAVVAQGTDVAGYKISEDALKESEEKYRTLVNNMRDTLYRSDKIGNITLVSPSGARLLGFSSPEELLGRNIAQDFYYYPEERLLLIQKLRKDGYVDNYEVTLKRKDGSQVIVSTNSHFYFDKNGIIAGVEGIFTDITERKFAAAERESLQAQLIQSQKLEAIGTLAGGIAHDFNNILMGIQGRASLMSIDPETPRHQIEHIHGIEEYIKSASDLTSQLLGIARGGKYEAKPTDVTEIVRDSATMFGRTKKEVKIHTKFQEASLVVDIDREQIKQVLLNIYINAWQAMPNGGNLVIETKCVMLDAANCDSYGIAPGRYCEISISDTGIGMDESTCKRIFDPFFTTKEKGRGTGLGLASAYGIIRNHNGMLTVNSKVGHGTTFKIYLPRSDKKAYYETSIAGEILKGSETILLVDDEKMIIDVSKTMLEWLGYRVIVARGGKEAIAEMEKSGNEIDLIILDMIMPELDGGKTFDLVREVRPGIPVILSSGYSINGQADEIMRRGCNGFVQKPFNISELSKKVRNILDESTG